jgi:hypothetical protein
MQILVDLVKVGAIGASLAFLLLSFWLLRAEIRLKDAKNDPLPPRRWNLVAIFAFMIFSLLVFIGGVVSEILLSNSPLIVSYFLRDDVVRVRFSGWEYRPEDKKILLGFLEEARNIDYYVPQKQKQDFDVYVAVRKRDAMSYKQGSYPVLIGPYGIESQPDIEKVISDGDLAQLGSECIDLVAVGIERKDGRPAEIVSPFTPAKIAAKTIIFNWAYVCNHE